MKISTYIRSFNPSIILSEYSLVPPYSYSPSRRPSGQRVPELTTVRVWSCGPWSLTSRCEGRGGRCVEGVDVLPWKSEDTFPSRCFLDVVVLDADYLALLRFPQA